MANLTSIAKNRSIISEDGMLTEESRAYFSLLEDLIPKNGVGSPEGVILSVAGATYYDLAAPVGERHYIKVVDAIDGDGRRGWSLA